MGQVVQFPEKEKMVELVTCSECQNHSFIIHTDMTVECSECRNITGHLDEILEAILDLKR